MLEKVSKTQQCKGFREEMGLSLLSRVPIFERFLSSDAIR